MYIHGCAYSKWTDEALLKITRVCGRKQISSITGQTVTIAHRALHEGFQVL